MRYCGHEIRQRGTCGHERGCDHIFPESWKGRGVSIYVITRVYYGSEYIYALDKQSYRITYRPKIGGIVRMHIGNIPHPSIFPESDDKAAAHISTAFCQMDIDSGYMYYNFFRIIFGSVRIKENSHYQSAFLKTL